MTLMMAITEDTVVAGIMTFFLYGVLPTLIILYIGGTGQRKRRRDQATQQRIAEMLARQAAARPDAAAGTAPAPALGADSAAVPAPAPSTQTMNREGGVPAASGRTDPDQ